MRWSHIALRDFVEATDYIARDHPTAAHDIAERIHAATDKLATYPYIGRPGEDDNSREWLVQRTPYLLVYEIRVDTIFILRVWHTRRRPLGEKQNTASDN